MKIRCAFILAGLCAALYMKGQGDWGSLWLEREHPSGVVSVDSVRGVLATLPATSRLPLLLSFVEESPDDANLKQLAHLLYREALEQQKEEYQLEAYYYLAKSAINTEPDSLRYWINESEPLFLKLKKYSELTDMKVWDIYTLSREGKRTEVLEAIEELRRWSQGIAYEPGVEQANLGLAFFYIENGFPKEGEELYVSILRNMETRNAPLIYRFNILRELFSKLPDQQKRILYLQEAEKYINDCKTNGINELGPGIPLYEAEYIVDKNYANELIHISRFEEAREYLQKAEEIVKTYNIYDAQIELPKVYLNYYMRRKDYRSTLHYIDQVEENARKKNSQTELYEVLHNRALIYKALGRSEEAVDLYEDLIYLKDQINETGFHKTLADIRTQYEVEKLELEKDQMENEARQTRLRMTFLIVGCLLMLGVIAALGYLIRVILRNRRELKLAKEKAEEADQLKSAFLANMNHEIRTPLNAIVGFSQVLIEEENQENRREFSEIIQNNNDLLQRLIADVLDISKIESNSMSLVYKEHDIAAMMKEISSVIFMRMQPGVELILDPCAPFVFETDRNRLMQVLTNLLTNAIKHTEKGYIRFGYHLSEEEVAFYVEDTGEGIEEAQLESIFDRFTQLENGKKGVGLGLAISKGLVTKMGGQIWATSVLGKGSTFHVRLPKVKPQGN